MPKESKKSKEMNQIQITDLIGEAVANASARRNQLSDLSQEEKKNIHGGYIIVMGYFPTDVA